MFIICVIYRGKYLFFIQSLLCHKSFKTKTQGCRLFYLYFNKRKMAQNDNFYIGDRDETFLRGFFHMTWRSCYSNLVIMSLKCQAHPPDNSWKINISSLCSSVLENSLDYPVGRGSSQFLHGNLDLWTSFFVLFIDYLEPWSFNPVFTSMLTEPGISSKIGQPENIKNVWKLPPFSIVNVISFFQAESLQNSVAN